LNVIKAANISLRNLQEKEECKGFDDKWIRRVQEIIMY
jgi:hypothetical protein